MRVQNVRHHFPDHVTGSNLIRGFALVPAPRPLPVLQRTAVAATIPPGPYHLEPTLDPVRLQNSEIFQMQSHRFP